MSKSDLWTQQITFYDRDNHSFVFTINASRNITMFSLMIKIRTILKSHFTVLKACFGLDIANNIRKFLPDPSICYENNGFYSHKDEFDMNTMTVYKIRNIISNSDRLFEVVRDHRHQNRELNIRLRAIGCYSRD
jgi:hypothetical protein